MYKKQRTLALMATIVLGVLMSSCGDKDDPAPDTSGTFRFKSGWWECTHPYPYANPHYADEYLYVNFQWERGMFNIATNCAEAHNHITVFYKDLQDVTFYRVGDTLFVSEGQDGWHWHSDQAEDAWIVNSVDADNISLRYLGGGAPESNYDYSFRYYGTNLNPDSL